MTTTFAITFDYLCPFARNGNEHVTAALRDGADYDVSFVPYSLAQGHVEEGDTAVWDLHDPESAAGILALQAGLVVRDTQPEVFLDVHDELFAARHDRGEDLKDRQVVADALGRGGADVEAVMAAAGTDPLRKQLRSEHEAGVADHAVWGVPTFIAGDRAVFVRLLDRPEGDGQRARTRIERVLELVAGEPMLHEFKQTDLPF